MRKKEFVESLMFLIWPSIKIVRISRPISQNVILYVKRASLDHVWIFYCRISKMFLKRKLVRTTWFVLFDNLDLNSYLQELSFPSFFFFPYTFTRIKHVCDVKASETKNSSLEDENSLNYFRTIFTRCWIEKKQQRKMDFQEPIKSNGN